MRRYMLLVLFAILPSCGGDAASSSTAAPASTAPADTTATTPPPATAAAVTSAPSTQPPTSAADATGTGAVGYIGCSMTRGAVLGYEALGGTRIWPAYDTAGAAIRAWANPDSPYWTLFDEQFAAAPPAELWVQVCVFKSGNHYEDLVAAIDLVRERCAGCPITIGWQPEYEPGWVCDILGPNGITRAREIAQQGVADGLGAADLSPMGPLGAGTVDAQDGCHVNDAGELLLGEQLLAYFG